MNNKYLQNNVENNDQIIQREELDFRRIYQSLKRQRVLFSCITGFSFLYTVFIYKTTVPTWQGQFQIVIAAREQPGGSRATQITDPFISTFVTGGGKGVDALRTEVAILQSPSVLKPVFNYLKNEKKNQGNDVSRWRYTSWAKKNLKIDLQTGTSVLEITYRDTDKEIILPVMEKISATYQNYSGRDRAKGLDQGISYLENQLSKQKKLANESLKLAQEFALDNNLGPRDGLPIPSAMGNEFVRATKGARSGSGSSRRDRLSTYDSLVSQTKQTTRHNDLYIRLRQMETTLVEKEALFKPNDQLIVTLKDRIKYLKEALKRPRDVLLRHRELQRTAQRNETILIQVESQLEALKLDQAKKTNPWELISTPTLQDSPVEPRRNRMLTIGTAIGLILATITSLIADRATGRFFSIEDMSNHLPFPLLKRLPADSTNSWKTSIELMVQGPLKITGKGSLALIPLGEIDPEIIENFSLDLRESLKDNQLVVSKDLLETKNCQSQLLLVYPGKITRANLDNLVQNLSLQQTPIAGWVYIDPELKL